MKHTKGTWEPFSYHNLEEEVEYGVSSSNGKYIGEEMTEGDANLIANAPEMLAVLKKVHKNMHIHYSDVPSVDVFEVSDLIAKVEGGGGYK